MKGQAWQVMAEILYFNEQLFPHEGIELIIEWVIGDLVSTLVLTNISTVHHTF